MEDCGGCLFRIPMGGRAFELSPKLRCALVKGPIRHEDVCDLHKDGPWIQDWRELERGDRKRSPSDVDWAEYKLPKGHTRVNYKRRVKSEVKEAPIDG